MTRSMLTASLSTVTHSGIDKADDKSKSKNCNTLENKLLFPIFVPLPRTARNIDSKVRYDSEGL